MRGPARGVRGRHIHTRKIKCSAARASGASRYMMSVTRYTPRNSRTSDSSLTGVKKSLLIASFRLSHTLAQKMPQQHRSYTSPARREPPPSPPAPPAVIGQRASSNSFCSASNCSRYNSHVGPPKGHQGAAVVGAVRVILLPRGVLAQLLARPLELAPRSSARKTRIVGVFVSRHARWCGTVFPFFFSFRRARLRRLYLPHRTSLT